MFIPHGSPDELFTKFDLDADSVVPAFAPPSAEHPLPHGSNHEFICWWRNRYRLEFTDHDNGVVLVTLNNPGNLNATDEVMHAELATVFIDLDRDPDVRVVVVTGEGNAFSAGGDLEWITKQVGNCRR